MQHGRQSRQYSGLGGQAIHLLSYPYQKVLLPNRVVLIIRTSVVDVTG